MSVYTGLFFSVSERMLLEFFLSLIYSAHQYIISILVIVVTLRVDDVRVVKATVTTGVCMSTCNLKIIITNTIKRSMFLISLYWTEFLVTLL